MSIYTRTCPVCGKTGENGQILAVLNEIHGNVADGLLIAGCGCRCGAEWKETYDALTGEFTNSEVTMRISGADDNEHS